MHLRLLATIFCCLCLKLPTSGAEWHEEVKVLKRDPYGIGPFHSISSTNRAFGTWKLAGNVSAGYGYVQLTKAEYADLATHSGQGKAGKLTFTNTLDAKEAAQWRGMFSKSAGAGEVPFLVGVASLANTPLSVATLLFDSLQQKANSGKVSPHALAELMIEGGEFQQFTQVLQDPEGHSYVLNNAFYKVEVAGKPRYYLVHSSRHAVQVK